MNRRTLDNIVFNNIETFDEETTDLLLSRYKVKFPPDREIEKTISTLAQYVPLKKPSKSLDRALSVCNVAVSDRTFVRKGYWLSCLLLFVAAYLFNNKTTDSLVVSTLFAPIPFTLGMLRLQRNRQVGAAELELSCKIPAHALMLAKISITGIFSIILNSLLSVAFYQTDPGASFWQLTFFWLTPFTLISYLALWLSMFSRDIHNLIYLTLLWLLVATLAQLDPGIVHWLTGLNTITYATLMASGALGLAFQLSRFITNYRSIIERFDLNAVNN